MRLGIELEKKAAVEMTMTMTIPGMTMNTAKTSHPGMTAKMTSLITTTTTGQLTHSHNPKQTSR